jgi:hypothetical protein
MNALRPGLFNGERQHFRDPSMNAMRLKLQRSEKIRLLRADSGVFDDKLLSFFGTAPAALHILAKLTPWVNRAAQRAWSNGWSWTMTTRRASCG